MSDAKRVGREHGPAKPSTWGPELRLTFRNSTELRHKFNSVVALVDKKEYLEIDMENQLERITQCKADILDAQEKIKNLSQKIKEINEKLISNQT